MKNSNTTLVIIDIVKGACSDGCWATKRSDGVCTADAIW